MTPEQKREQAISFVYGQLASNPNVTRELVAEVYDKMKEQDDLIEGEGRCETKSLS